jgi:hypothetical protein
MNNRTAQCACGQLSLTAKGEPLRISVCHCKQCQRRTGSPFGQQARFPRERVEIRGEGRRFERVADSGNRIAFNFCPECGSTVYYEMQVAPDVYGVPVGCFADPDFPAPRVSVYGEHRHHWVTLPGDIELS